jgi:hypothetical protein
MCPDVSLPKAVIAADTSGLLVGWRLRTLSTVMGVAANTQADAGYMLQDFSVTPRIMIRLLSERRKCIKAGLADGS